MRARREARARQREAIREAIYVGRSQ